MKKKIFVLIIISVLLFFPSLAVSDCTDLGHSTSWYVQDEQTIICYAQNKPLAQIVLQDCTVSRSSNIRLLKSYVCDGDSLMVDGQECAITALTISSVQ